MSKVEEGYFSFFFFLDEINQFYYLSLCYTEEEHFSERNNVGYFWGMEMHMLFGKTEICKVELHSFIEYGKI